MTKRSANSQQPKARGQQPKAGGQQSPASAGAFVTVSRLALLAVLASGCGGGTSGGDAGIAGEDAKGPGVVYTAPDGGARDGSFVPPDAGTDGGTRDEGTADDGARDTGEQDTGAEDAGGDADAGVSDSGSDTSDPSDASVPSDAAHDAGQYDAGMATGRVVINEVMKIPGNGDPQFGQYVEILNDSDDAIDLEGWTLKADQASFTFSSDSGETGIAARDVLVVGASDDDAKNSYAHVRYVWPPTFKLPAGNCALRLQNQTTVTVDAVSWDATFPFAGGSSIERKGPALDGNAAASWQRAPSLITFLPETGEFAGDRGSPGRPNYRINNGSKVPIGATGVSSRIDAPSELWRFPVDVKARDIMEFVADVDGASGDLWAFLTILDAGGEIIWKDVVHSQAHRDFRIQFVAEADATLTMQIQADFAYSFDPGDFTAMALLADLLDAGVPNNRLSIKRGETFWIAGARALFSADPDAEAWPLAADRLAFSSLDPQIASVDAAGVITGLKAGGTAVTVKYAGGTQDLVVVLAVDVQDLPANDTCDAAIDISGTPFLSGSTSFAADDYDPDGCLAAFVTGPDIVYSFSSGAARTWKFTVTPLWDYNPMLYVFDACPPAGNCVDGTKFSGKGDAETLEFQAQANKTYYLVVDGDLAEGDDAGTFTLTVE